MAMKRLSSLMQRKWRETERWTGRRRSEPCGGGEEEEEDERQTDRRMLRRTSEPCGQMEEETKSESARKKERRKSESSVEEEVRRRAETGRGVEKRKSSSWVMAEDRAGGQADKRRTLRRRSEPCGVLYVQLLPLSNRKRKELLQRRTGRRTSCSEEGCGRTDRTQEQRRMSRGRSEPVGPLDNSKKRVHEYWIHTAALLRLLQHFLCLFQIKEPRWRPCRW